MIQGRIFLVGCSRSGTTLLQSLLATQPVIAAFPESHLFTRSVTTRNARRMVRWGLRPPAMPQQLRVFAQQLGYGEQQARLPRYTLWLKSYMAAFVWLLDDKTVQQGKTIWLEKTPGHIRYIDLIEHYVTGAKFIHLVRNGTDVVASLYAVSRQHPRPWGGAHTIDRCITKWQTAVQTSIRHLRKPNHCLIRYEALVADPPAVIERVCGFIGIPADRDLLDDYPRQAAAVSLPDEPWKASTTQPIANRNGTRFDKLFDEQQRTYIYQALSPVEQMLERL